MIDSTPEDILEQIRYKMEWQKYAENIRKIIPCKRCGKCCEFPVNVFDREILKISEYLKIPVEDFKKKYFQHGITRNYLKIPCPFLKDNNICTIYPVRPKLCREYPFVIDVFSLRGVNYCPEATETFSKLKEFCRKEGIFIPEHNQAIFEQNDDIGAYIVENFPINKSQKSRRIQISLENLKRFYFYLKP